MMGMLYAVRGDRRFRRFVELKLIKWRNAHAEQVEPVEKHVVPIGAAILEVSGQTPVAEHPAQRVLETEGVDGRYWQGLALVGGQRELDEPPCFQILNKQLAVQVQVDVEDGESLCAAVMG